MQLALRLHEIGAEQQRSRRARARARIARRNSLRGRRVEVADVGAEQQHEHRMRRRRAPRRRGAGRLRRSRGGRRPRSDRRRPSVRSDCSSACGEMSIRCTRPRPPAACSASARMTSFSPLPHPSSTNSGTTRPIGSRRAARRSRRRAPPAAALGARDAVPRQPADRLEQARAERVVEILRLQLLRREREIAPHVGGEIGVSCRPRFVAWRSSERVGCGRYLAVRNFA